MLWGNYYLTETGGEVITEIAVAFGPTFPSLADGPVTFWLLDDPDMDLDPRNATALAHVEATPDVFNDDFFAVSIPPTPVSGAFFVGVSAFLQGGEDRPARVDTAHPGDRSWFFYDPDVAAVIDDLAAAAYGTRMDGPDVIFPGAFMVRASGTPSTVAAEDEAPAAPLALDAVYPNPVATTAHLAYSLPEAGPVTLAVYDLLGRVVETLVDGAQAAGAHAVRWEASPRAAGVYLVRLEAGGQARTRPLVVRP
jgi:hypothetical protein